MIGQALANWLRPFRSVTRLFSQRDSAIARSWLRAPTSRASHLIESKQVNVSAADRRRFWRDLAPIAYGVIADLWGRGVGVIAAALTAAAIIPLSLALRPFLLNRPASPDDRPGNDR